MCFETLYTIQNKFEINDSMQKDKKLKQICYICFALYVITVFIIYLANYVPLKAKNFDMYGSTYLFVDYSMGFVPRGLLGSLLKPFIEKNANHLVLSLVFMKVIFIGLLFSILLFVLYKIQKRVSLEGWLLICLISVRPFYLFSRMYEIRNDNIWYLFLPLMLYAIQKETKQLNLVIILGLLSTICMLCHQAFIFTFAPLLCVLLVLKQYYKTFIGYGLLLSAELVGITCGATYDFNSLATTVFSRIYNTNLPNIFTAKFTNWQISLALNYVYNSSVITQLQEETFLQTEYVEHLHTLVYLAVFSCVSLCVSIYVLIKWQQDWKKKLSIVLILLLPMIVLAILTIDCDRWFLMLLTELNILAIYIVCYETIRDIKFNKLWYIVYVAESIASCFVFMVKDY